ncbi:MAG: iron ABC transporter permease, partial [Lachnospiraceae bacterium]|nr:iron ABC transporter permease [Lachnospiraceae bacterium]
MKKRIVITYVILIVSILILIVLNLLGGSSDVSCKELLRVLLSHDTTDVYGVIVWNIRLPRLLEAIALGGALALSGYLLQSFFANPIAGPYVLGISSGAKFIVAILMVISCSLSFSLSSIMMVIAAFIGSGLSALLVIMVARNVKSMSILIVCGVMIGYVCSALTELIVAFADDTNIVNLHNWSMGSFGAASWSNLSIIYPTVLVGLIASILLSKGIYAYLFGEDYARSVGMNVKVFRILLIVVSSLLSAVVTAFAGPISFVGIAVPHVIRSVTKTTNTKVMISAS